MLTHNTKIVNMVNLITADNQQVSIAIVSMQVQSLARPLFWKQLLSDMKISLFFMLNQLFCFHSTISILYYSRSSGSLSFLPSLFLSPNMLSNLYTVG